MVNRQYICNLPNACQRQLASITNRHCHEGHSPKKTLDMIPTALSTIVVSVSVGLAGRCGNLTGNVVPGGDMINDVLGSMG